MIDACARAGEAAVAQRMAWDMVKEGLRPSTHTFVLLAKAYLRASLPAPPSAALGPRCAGRCAEDTRTAFIAWARGVCNDTLGPAAPASRPPPARRLPKDEASLAANASASKPGRERQRKPGECMLYERSAKVTKFCRSSQAAVQSSTTPGNRFTERCITTNWRHSFKSQGPAGTEGKGEGLTQAS